MDSRAAAGKNAAAMSTWFDTARFGMFIHWGHCSQSGWELSWPLVGGVGVLPDGQSVGVEEYHAGAKTFNPVNFDAHSWARLARQTGMQYAVLTSKHHDGFAMFHTRESDFSIEHTPFRRDIVREYVEAFRAEGLKVGLYFSLLDWHHPDYPAFRESDKPYRFGSFRRSTPAQWDNFIRFMFAQIRELLTNYGKIDLIWFDGGWERKPEEWKSAELVAMIKELQPEILINDRLPGYGDFKTPEQAVPPTPPNGPWETCLTINNSWGYNPSDTNLKSTRMLVHTLCEVAGKGGNLLLNVSPTGTGELPREQVTRLHEIGEWISRNEEGILGTTPGLEPWQFYGPSTRRGNRIYLHLLMRPYDSVSVRGVKVKHVIAARSLGSTMGLKFSRRIGAADMIFNPDPIGEIIIYTPATALDSLATVIALDMDPT
ncbi:MAG TPA: alpha-L-fucosidase [Candidatus Binataceae bacterium]|nr:alpha-L-fucosidase [Candidatus Binataceae bacterium]